MSDDHPVIDYRRALTGGEVAIDEGPHGIVLTYSGPPLWRAVVRTTIVLLITCATELVLFVVAVQAWADAEVWRALFLMLLAGAFLLLHLKPRVDELRTLTSSGTQRTLELTSAHFSPDDDLSGELPVVTRVRVVQLARYGPRIRLVIEADGEKIELDCFGNQPREAVQAIADRLKRALHLPEE